MSNTVVESDPLVVDSLVAESPVADSVELLAVRVSDTFAVVAACLVADVVSSVALLAAGLATALGAPGNFIKNSLSVGGRQLWSSHACHSTIANKETESADNTRTF
ncbi:hypothetical protein SDC9_206585 [bioreactor metagenome]|uniref:Uncharacterized protein n=1 Tax=bioreactor metagenome TaxID=1076179 RepID=A0A645J852_9ZZZZ